MNVFRTAQNSGAFGGHGVPCDLLSYLPYPRPLRVFIQTIVGTFAGLSPRAPSSTARVTGPHSEPCSVPTTRQPYGANQSTGVPCTTDEQGLSSIPQSFQSTRNTRFERPRPHAEFLVSCEAPGVRPPSPSTTN